MGIGRSSLVSEDRGGGNGTTMAGCPYSEGQVAGTAALGASIVLFKQFSEIVGVQLHETKSTGEVAGPGGPAGWGGT